MEESQPSSTKPKKPVKFGLFNNSQPTTFSTYTSVKLPYSTSSTTIPGQSNAKPLTSSVPTLYPTNKSFLPHVSSTQSYLNAKQPTQPQIQLHQSKFPTHQQSTSSSLMPQTSTSSSEMTINHHLQVQNNNSSSSLSYQNGLLKQTSKVMTPSSTTSTTSLALPLDPMKLLEKKIDQQHSETSSQSIPPISSMQPSSWPPSLQSVLENAFHASTTQKERLYIGKFVAKVAEQARKDGTLWIRDWSSLTIPPMSTTLPAITRKRKSLEREVPPPSESTALPISHHHHHHNGTMINSFNRSYLDDDDDDDEFKQKNSQQEQREQQAVLVQKSGVVDREMQIKKKARFFEHQREQAVLNSKKIVGTSTALEKKYLRLTSEADASTVRPEPILKKSFQLVQEKYRDTKDYAYCSEQLKSIRQDLVVQLIQNSFSLQVYEYAARLSLKHGDMAEYLQCNTQLQELYHREDISRVNLPEFTCYRILYMIFMDENLNLMRLLKELTVEQKKHKYLQFALDFYGYFTLMDYYRIFLTVMVEPRLLIQQQQQQQQQQSGNGVVVPSPPLMVPYLFAMFKDKYRLLALKAYVKAYRPMEISLTYIQKMLRFSRAEEFHKFLDHNKVLYHIKSDIIDCKNTTFD